MTDALQEVTAELEQAEADNIMLIGRIEELEAKLAKAVGALVVINALAPESMVNGYSQSDLTELVSRMGKVTRTTLAELKGQDDG